jgi:hypothetical protein
MRDSSYRMTANFSGGADEFSSICVELLFVPLHTEVIGLTLADRLRSSRHIYIHFTHRTEGMLFCRDGHLGVDSVRIWVHPALTLVFQMVSGLEGGLEAVIALDNPQRKINARGKAPRTG